MATKEVKIIKPTVANANNNLIRMAAYCRVSTDSADQVNSFMAQVAFLYPKSRLTMRKACSTLQRIDEMRFSICFSQLIPS